MRIGVCSWADKGLLDPPLSRYHCERERCAFLADLVHDPERDRLDRRPGQPAGDPAPFEALDGPSEESERLVSAYTGLVAVTPAAVCSLCHNWLSRPAMTACMRPSGCAAKVRAVALSPARES